MRRPGGPELRFILTLAGFALVAVLGYRDEYLGPVLVPLRTLTADLTLTLIRALGLDAVRHGTVISHSAGFAYQISRGCTGVIPALLLAVGVLAWPGVGRRKLFAVALGVPLVLGLNQVRLVHLFYMGVRRPELFGFAHEVLWETVMVSAVFGLWLGFTRWTGAPAERRGGTSTPSDRTASAWHGHSACDV
ncbi:MAG TPA: exosortase H [Gemmatimonadales bacterium]